MIRYRNLLLLFLFLGSNGYSQSSKIKWGLYGKKTVEERRATFPFSEAKKVVLVAFPSPNAVFEDEEDDMLKKDSIDIVGWGLNVLKTYKLPQREDKYIAIEKIELSQNQIDSLSHILINYKLKNDKLPETYTVYASGCYEPRNAILFLDTNDTVISYFEICFECHEFSQLPMDKTIVNMNTISNLPEAMKMLDLIREFMKSCGIKYGVVSKKFKE
ncbi:MAG: hypothetical protein L6Q46_05985 [Flavobacterium sp.]|uniref:hypothetical protein n=1 Tax=Flavobacterium sp. TaxID=239 RepID=UPI0025C43ACD|nr:hypothetical protein [Flavobacterium sp.]MCK6607840.1 hypothetical protein [Flavobacterium sp.]